jgi:hypothetical protein
MNKLKELCKHPEIQKFNIWNVDTIINDDYTIQHQVCITCNSFYDMYHETLEVEINVTEDAYEIVFPEDERRVSFKTDNVTDIVNSIKQEFPKQKLDEWFDIHISKIQESLKESGYEIKTNINPNYDICASIFIEYKDEHGYTVNPLVVRIGKDKSFLVEYTKDANSIDDVQTLLHGLITRYGV